MEEVEPRAGRLSHSRNLPRLQAIDKACRTLLPKRFTPAVFGVCLRCAAPSFAINTEGELNQILSLLQCAWLLTRHSVLIVKAETIATFLWRKIAPNLAQEIGNQFSTRIEGTCIKHRFGKSSIKMYDKLGIILRIETTTNDVSSFKHDRKVEHRKAPPLSGKTSTASMPWPTSSSPAIAATLPISRRSTIVPTASDCSTASPGRARSTARPSPCERLS